MSRASRRFVRDGAASRQQRDGRRGAVFSIRLTDEERATLDVLRAELGGPRSIGAWLRWAALASRRRGNTRAPTSSGITTRAARRGSVLGQVGYYPLERRIVLDLCSGSGAWSEPYKRAGYDVRRVTLPTDVRTWSPPTSAVWGVLAAPPCEAFSLAANGHKALERQYARALEVVCASLRIVALARPKWWALENPCGYLHRWLGTPRDVFEPCDFGDAWTKRTALWGSFALPQRGPFVEPEGAGPRCIVCKGKRRQPRCSRADHRAVTPPGFARAFFEANP